MYLRSALSRFILYCGLLTSLIAFPAYAAPPTATVVARTLNVRSGPGTNYVVISAAAKGTRFAIVGQFNNCSWLRVVDAKKQEGWVAGTSQYVSIDTPCKQLSVAPPPNNPPAAQPTATPSGQPKATPTAQPAPAQPANLGCYLFQNQLGSEVTVTFTAQDGNWTQTFKLQHNTEQVQCFAPGHYRYTLDAPPPWDSVNGELTVHAGDHYYFPIRPRK